jgi:hypothetical protein
MKVAVGAVAHLRVTEPVALILLAVVVLRMEGIVVPIQAVEVAVAQGPTPQRLRSAMVVLEGLDSVSYSQEDWRHDSRKNLYEEFCG